MRRESGQQSGDGDAGRAGEALAAPTHQCHVSTMAVGGSGGNL